MNLLHPFRRRDLSEITIDMMGLSTSLTRDPSLENIARSGEKAKRLIKEAIKAKEKSPMDRAAFISVSDAFSRTLSSELLKRLKEMQEKIGRPLHS